MLPVSREGIRFQSRQTATMPKAIPTDVTRMSIIVRDENALAIPERSGQEVLKEQVDGDLVEYYSKWRRAIMDGLEPQTDKDWNVKLPSIKLMELVARVLKLDVPAGGVSIVNQINNNPTTNHSGVTLESLVRRSEERSKPAAVDAEYEVIEDKEHGKRE